MTESFEQRKKKVLRRKQPDYILIACTFLILAFGIVMIYSSSNYYNLQHGRTIQGTLNDTYLWAFIGTFAFVTASLIRYTFYKKMRYFPVVLFFTLTLAGLVWVFFSDSVRGVNRWIFIGDYQLQPSEFAKLAVVMMIAAYVDKFKPWMGDWTRGLVHLGALFFVILFISGLIFLEPNKSTAFVVMMIGVLLLVISGARMLIVLPATALVTGAGYFYIVATGQAVRLAVHFGDVVDYSAEGWQIYQSLIAFGLGGVLGAGLGNGTQNKLYLPEGFNDFILGNIAEELGFVGVVFLLLLYLVVIYRCFKIAMNAPDTFSSLLVSGIAIMLSIHVLLNYMVTTRMIPTTGITLPLVSYGGTSMVVFMGALGMVNGISTYAEDEVYE